MTTAAPALRLHPDRLLPPEPGVRAIARRLYEVVRDLPILSPHGHVDPRLLLDDEPFADPASPVGDARPLRDPAAARQRGPAGRARRRAAASSPRPRRARCGGCSARTGTSTAARPSGTGWRRSWPRSSRCRCAPPPQTADAIYDQVADRLAKDALPAAGAVRAVPHPGAGHHRRPVRRPVRARRPGRRPDLHRAGHPDVPARPLPGARPARVAGRGGPARRGGRPRHRGLRRASCGRWRRGDGTSSPTAPSPPTTATTTSAPTRSSRPRRPGSSAPRWPARRPRPRRWRCGGTCCWRWRGCRATTGW